MLIILFALRKLYVAKAEGYLRGIERSDVAKIMDKYELRRCCLS